MSISAEGSVNGKNDGPEAHVEVVGLEELAHEVGEHDLQVLEADVLADPQAFALVEHRRVRGVAVDAVGAARRDDADLGHRVDAGVYLRACARIAHLHRAGVGAQVQPAALGVLQVDVEGVLHRARRVVLGVFSAVKLIQSVSISGPSATSKPIDAEDGLDALDRAADRVQPADAARRPGR
jgi:hypothetical protein